MFLAAFSSRSREQPHSQECQRWDRSFGTTRPQLEHSCVVPRASTTTNATPALSALDRNVSRKLPQATSLIARASRSDCIGGPITQNDHGGRVLQIGDGRLESRYQVICVTED